MEASTDYFISVIECNRILYDKTSVDYKNVLKKEEAWKRIANVTKMTVTNAKKRYNSIRQKYCREKQKIEVAIRTKRHTGRPWAFYERLHFLDAFIHPRTTYTNDTGFQNVQGIHSDADARISDDVSLDIEEASMIDNNERTMNVHSETTGQADMEIISYNLEDVQDHNSLEFIGDCGNTISLISEYSGEATTFTPLNLMHVSNTSRDDISQSDRGNDVTTLNGHCGVSLASKTLSQQELPRSNSSSQGSATTTLQNRINVASPAPRQISQTAFTQPSRIATTSTVATTSSSSSAKDKQMEAIRNKMDSCLTAIATKVAEKPGRNPHAPFLAYLGTKLPKVPKEKISELEKAILDLVDSFC